MSVQRSKIAVAVAAALCLCVGDAIAVHPYTFTTIDFPGAVSTEAFGINNAGEVVGTYFDGIASHGFRYKGGVIAAVDFPGSNFTQAFDINNKGQILGQTLPGLFGTQGFSIGDKTYITVNLNGAGTAALGANDKGKVVGIYSDGVTYHGFILENGISKTIDVPGSTLTDIYGINNDGIMVGDYDHRHGFHSDGSAFTTFDVPGSQQTFGLGINSKRHIVGLFQDAGGAYHGFLLKGNKFTTIDVPGAIFTRVSGINDLGQIVGEYRDAAGLTHGFVATKPGDEEVGSLQAPGSAPKTGGIEMLGAAFAALSVYCLKHRTRAILPRV